MKLVTKIALILICMACSIVTKAQDANVYDYRLDAKALNDPKNPIPYEILHSPLFGKTINVFGASRARNQRQEITDTWHCKVAKKYHMLYRNYARNNCCISFDRRRERWSAPINEFYEDMDTCDYILLIGGHSDAEQIIKGKGTVEEFEEGFVKLLRGFIRKMPEAKVAVMTPWKNTNSPYPEVTRIMVENCQKFAIPVFDCSTQSGIYAWDLEFARRFFQNYNDNTHLNEKGHNLFMNKGEKFLLGL